MLTMLQKYVIAFNHRASLPHPHKTSLPWALAARALTLLQLGVGLTFSTCVCEHLGGVQYHTCLCPGALLGCPDLLWLGLHGLLSSRSFDMASGCSYGLP